MLARIHVERVIGTGLSAGFAAYASAAVEIDDPILSGKQCRNRTDLNARSVGAMVAPHHGKQPASIGKCPLFDVLYPRAVYADGDLVLGLAGYGTCMAADAFSVVDYEAKIH